MNTCDTCKWWDRQSYSVDPPFVGRKCFSPLFEDSGSGNPEGSVTQSGMDAGYVELLTGPKFGCIHHESK